MLRAAAAAAGLISTFGTGFMVPKTDVNLIYEAFHVNCKTTHIGPKISIAFYQRIFLKILRTSLGHYYSEKIKFGFLTVY
jgi:hypothetical protein